MNQELPILYSFRRCPYAIRARLALAYAGIPVELREVVLKDKPVRMLELSPKGTVPVLQLPDGDVLDESYDIMLWALAQHDPNNWHEPSYQDDIAALIKKNDDEFKYWLDRYKYSVGYPEHSEEYYRNKGEEFLAYLEALLEKNRYLLADHTTLADMGVFPFIRQFAFVDKGWFDQSPYPKLQVWLQEQLDSGLFKGVMFKYGQWKAGDEPVVFPQGYQ